MCWRGRWADRGSRCHLTPDAHSTTDEGRVVASLYGTCVGEVDEPTEVSLGALGLAVILQLTHMTQ